MSDDCDYNFGTFDNFDVKNDQKVSHNNMILMSRYKGHGGKKDQKNRAGVSPPFRAMPERKHFFSGRCSLLHRTQPLVVEKILQNTEKLRQFPENNIAINTEQKISPTGSLERVTGVELLSFEQLECMLVERPVRL